MELAWFAERISHDPVLYGTCKLRVCSMAKLKSDRFIA
jgi:hypothetical protein